MNSKIENFKKISLRVFQICLFLSMIFLLVGCSQEQSNSLSNNMNNIPNLAYFDQSQMQTFVVDTEDNGNVLVSEEIYDEPEYDKFEEWQRTQSAKEGTKEYNMYRDVIENAKAEKESQEEELERYCNSLHSNSCLSMTHIENRYSCNKITVECKKYDTEDICVRYVISVKEEALDKDDCI